MKNTLQRLFVVVILTGLMACGPRISKDRYVKVMSEMGCRNTSESTPEAAEILKSENVTPDDIAQFRKKAGIKVMTEAVGEIAAKVMKCHNVMTAPSPAP